MDITLDHFTGALETKGGPLPNAAGGLHVHGASQKPKLGGNAGTSVLSCFIDHLKSCQPKLLGPKQVKPDKRHRRHHSQDTEENNPHFCMNYATSSPRNRDRNYNLESSFTPREQGIPHQQQAASTNREAKERNPLTHSTSTIHFSFLFLSQKSSNSSKSREKWILCTHPKLQLNDWVKVARWSSQPKAPSAEPRVMAGPKQYPKQISTWFHSQGASPRLREADGVYSPLRGSCGGCPAPNRCTTLPIAFN